MASNKIKIIIADDHALFRSGILELLKDSEYEVIAEASNGVELILLYNDLMPDLLLVDISMPQKSGIEAAKEIISISPKSKILFLSMYDNEDYIYTCYKAGALGLINKNISKEELLSALDKVNQGCFSFSVNDAALLNIVEKYEKNEHIFLNAAMKLTRRETLILKYISEGLTSQEIADILSLSKRTVDSHRIHLARKLNIYSLPELIRYAIEFTKTLK